MPGGGARATYVSFRRVTATTPPPGYAPSGAPRLDDFSHAIDLLRIDQHLDVLIQDYGSWTYAILAGVVMTPFLPGDSLLFGSGVLAARDALELPILLVTLTLAAIASDNLNYWLGRFIGPRLLKRRPSWLLSEKHLDRTHAFFARYGAVTVVLARYVAVVRTVAPLVAGVAAMPYPRYLAFSVFGAVLWVASCTLAGYFLGNVPVIRDNFELALLTILGFTLLGPLVEWARRLRGAEAPH